MMAHNLRIALAQQMFTVGDVQGNTEKIVRTMLHAYAKLQATICVFPELALCGYPPEDLLWLPDFQRQMQQGLHTILQASAQCPTLYILLGLPYYVEEKIFNSLAVIKCGAIIDMVHKLSLPHQGVFEELRYFSPGVASKVITISNVKIGLAICEDIWDTKFREQLGQQGVGLVLAVNASPYATGKHQQRLTLISQFAAAICAPVLYLNGVNAQDDLIFDGGSCCVDAVGQLVWQGEFYHENIYLLEFMQHTGSVITQTLPPFTHLPSDLALNYQALVFGLREYVQKNHIPGVILGLSGGIDSALTLAIAVDAVGADRVLAVSMPAQHTANISIEYAEKQAGMLGVAFKVIDIRSLYNEFIAVLTPHFIDCVPDSTEENLQARCRGTVLMALANKYRRIVLGTSNKSELAMGYATLYGDMVGAYAVLKDVLKTDVYRLVEYRNTVGLVIPPAVIQRAPTAELAPNQTDQDSLPPYPVLDEIIRRYVELQQSTANIIAAGFAAELVQSVVSCVNRNEYKRRQAPPGPKISVCAFTRERHYPITANFVV